MVPAGGPAVEKKIRPQSRDPADRGLAAAALMLPAIADESPPEARAVGVGRASDDADRAVAVSLVGQTDRTPGTIRVGRAMKRAEASGKMTFIDQAGLGALRVGGTGGAHRLAVRAHRDLAA